MKKNLVILLSAAALTFGAAAIVATERIVSLSAESARYHGTVTATFVNYDGAELYESEVAFGATAIYEGQTPVRPAAKGISYVFSGWDKPLSGLDQDTVFRAQYEESYETFTATFLNLDGSFLYAASVDPGVAPEYKGPTPKYKTIEGVDYVWTGAWDKPLEPLTKDTTYIAEYDRIDHRRKCVFYYPNGTVYRTIYVRDGEDVQDPGNPGGEVLSPDGKTSRWGESLGWDKPLTGITEDTDFYPVMPSYEETFYSISHHGSWSYGKENKWIGIYYIYEGYSGYDEATKTLTLPTSYAGMAFESVDRLNTGFEVENIIVPEGFTRLSAEALINLSSLKTLQLPSTLSIIEWNAVSCPELEKVEFPNGNNVKTISSNAFSNTKLTSFPHSSELVELDPYAFSNTAIFNNSFEENGASYFYLNEGETVLYAYSDADAVITNGIRSDCTYISVREGSYNSTYRTYPSLVLPEGLVSVSNSGSLFAGVLFESITLPSTLRRFQAYFDHDQGRLDFAGTLDQFVRLERPNLYSTSEMTVGGQPITEVVIPEDVVRIPDYAFRNVRTLTKVTFHEGLEYIGSQAFEYTSLQEIEIPSSVRNVGYHAFGDIYTLTKAIFLGDDDIPDLGGGIFCSCSKLAELRLPSKLTKIPYEMFRWCTNIGSLELPDTLVEIGDGAFEHSLLEFTIPASVRSIGYHAFSYGNNYDDSRIFTVDFLGGLEQYMQPNIRFNRIYDWMESSEYVRFHLRFNGEEVKNVVIPEETTFVRDYLFDGAIDLESVDVLGNIYSLGKKAFAHCPNLSQVALPNTIRAFSGDAFTGCASLTNVSFEDNPNFTSYNGGVYDKDFTTLYFVAPSSEGDYVVKEGTAIIGDGACSLASKITSLTMPDTVRVIGGNILPDADLEFVQVSKNLIYAGSYALSGANYHNIKRANLPASLRSGEYFFGRNHVQELTVEKGFGQNRTIFSLCIYNFHKIYFQGSVEEFVSSYCYQGKNGWTWSLWNAEELYCYDNDEQFKRCSFEDLMELESIQYVGADWTRKENYEWHGDLFSHTIRHLGPQSLWNLQAKSITLCNVEKIDSGASSSLTCDRLDFRGSSMEELPDEAINCSAIRRTYLNEGLKRIGKRALHSWNSAVAVVVPSTLEAVDEFAFVIETNEDYYTSNQTYLLLPQGRNDMVDLFANAEAHSDLQYVFYDPDKTGESGWYYDEDNLIVTYGLSQDFTENTERVG